MRITAVRPVFVDRYLFCRITPMTGSRGSVSRGRGGTWNPRPQWSTSSRITWWARIRCGSSTTGSTFTVGHTSAGQRSWVRSALSISHYGTSPGSTSACRSTNCSAGRPETRRVSTTTSSAVRARLVRGCIEAKAKGFTAVGTSDALPGRAARSCPFSRPTLTRCATPSTRWPPTERRWATKSTSDRNPPATYARRSHGAGARDRAVPPVLLRGPDPARQL